MKQSNKISDAFCTGKTAAKRYLCAALLAAVVLTLLFLPYIWEASFLNWISVFFAVGTYYFRYFLAGIWMVLLIAAILAAAVANLLKKCSDTFAAQLCMLTSLGMLVTGFGFWYTLVSREKALSIWYGIKDISFSIGAFLSLLIAATVMIIAFSMRFERLAKRDTISRGKAWGIRLIAFLAALFSGALIIMALNYNPIDVYRDMLLGAVGKPLFVQETVKLAVPLLITAIGTAFAFKMRFWNIGGEGQILVGGIAASTFAVYFGGQWPQTTILIIMGVAAILGGGIYGVIPALFKSKWNTNETLFTLMLNYIALQFVRYLAYQKAWLPVGSIYPKIKTFEALTRLPKLFGVHIGWIFAIVIVIVAYIYMTRTKQGYEITVVGESNSTARYAGMNVSKVFIRTMFISGALAGFAGFLQVAGADGTLTEATAGGKGFTAITVAWLAKMNPLVMMIVASFMAVLERGSNRIQTIYGIPEAAAEVLIGIILFFMLGCEFFINYKLIFFGRQKEEA